MAAARLFSVALGGTTAPAKKSTKSSIDENAESIALGPVTLRHPCGIIISVEMEEKHSKATLDPWALKTLIRDSAASFLTLPEMEKAVALDGALLAFVAELKSEEECEVAMSRLNGLRFTMAGVKGYLVVRVTRKPAGSASYASQIASWSSSFGTIGAVNVEDDLAEICDRTIALDRLGRGTAEILVEALGSKCGMVHRSEIRDATSKESRYDPQTKQWREILPPPGSVDLFVMFEGVMGFVNALKALCGRVLQLEGAKEATYYRIDLDREQFLSAEHVAKRKKQEDRQVRDARERVQAEAKARKDEEERVVREAAEKKRAAEEERARVEREAAEQHRELEESLRRRQERTERKRAASEERRAREAEEARAREEERVAEMQRATEERARHRAQEEARRAAASARREREEAAARVADLERRKLELEDMIQRREDEDRNRPDADVRRDRSSSRSRSGSPRAASASPARGDQSPSRKTLTSAPAADRRSGSRSPSRDRAESPRARDAMERESAAGVVPVRRSRSRSREQDDDWRRAGGGAAAAGGDEAAAAPVEDAAPDAGAAGGGIDADRWVRDRYDDSAPPRRPAVRGRGSTRDDRERGGEDRGRDRRDGERRGRDDRDRDRNDRRDRDRDRDRDRAGDRDGGRGRGRGRDRGSERGRGRHDDGRGPRGGEGRREQRDDGDREADGGAPAAEEVEDQTKRVKSAVRVPTPPPREPPPPRVQPRLHTGFVGAARMLTRGLGNIVVSVPAAEPAPAPAPPAPPVARPPLRGVKRPRTESAPVRTGRGIGGVLQAAVAAAAADTRDPAQPSPAKRPRIADEDQAQPQAAKPRASVFSRLSGM